jgi:hypothetical protein
MESRRQQLATEAQNVQAREAASQVRQRLDHAVAGLEAQLAERAEALARRADRQAAREDLARERRGR